MTEHLTLETERLLLRPTSEEDAAFILELMNTPKWLKNIGDRKVKTVEDARAYIQTKMMLQLERLGFGNYTVFRKSDGVKLGTCGLYDREGLEGVDIGFAFLPQYEGQGFAFESAQKVKESGIHLFGIKQISAITTPENIASQKLIIKLGLQFIDKTILPDDDVELFLYRWNA